MTAEIEFQRLLPEITISVMACVILLVGQINNKNSEWLSYLLSLVTLAVTGLLATFSIDGSSQTILNGMFIEDAFANLIKALVCWLTLIVFVYSRNYCVERTLARVEYYVLGLFGVLGMMVMASASHLLVLYLGLELMSLCLYSMVAFSRDSANATEAAMKYFVLGAIASGCLLYGMSILYGLTGTLEIAAIKQSVFTISPDSPTLIFAVIFVIVALAFKLGAAPFHMWVPDVYHGAPTSTTLYLGTAPKIAAFAMLIRLLVGGLDNLQDVWQDMFIIIALLSIITGNVIAIAQTNLKRMLAYSTIAHMGFLLLGVLSGGDEGYSASLFYVMVYSVMSLGAFGVIALCAREGYESDMIEDYRGLNASNPWLAFLILLLMFSLAGVPPTVGFYAKFAVIQALVSVGQIWVAIVAVLFAVVGAFYYLRVVKVMYFDAPPEQEMPTPTIMRESKVLMSMNSLLLIGILPWVGGVLALCNFAISSLQ